MRIRLAFLLGLLLLALAGIGGAAAASSAVVVISDGFDPAVLRVPIGTTVTWRNADDQRHRVRSREGPLEFDSGDLEPGESFSFRFGIEGRFGYLDVRDEEDERRDGPGEKAGASGTIVVDPPTVEATPSAHASAASIPASTLSASVPVTSPVLSIAPSAASTASPVTPTASPSSRASAPAVVDIADRGFEPSEVAVAVGETVRWTNSDGEGHTVTAADGSFDSGLMAGGMAFAATFEAPGTVDYACAIHPEMRGRVIVTPLETGPGADGTAGATASPVADPRVSLPPADGANVAIVKSAYGPASLEVPAGVTVTWTNDDPVAHTVTARDGSFSSGVIRAGEEFTFTFDAPGTYDYFCAIHPGQAGTIVVSDPGT